jgi:hypothetical protein
MNCDNGLHINGRRCGYGDDTILIRENGMKRFSYTKAEMMERCKLTFQHMTCKSNLLMSVITIAKRLCVV